MSLLFFHPSCSGRLSPVLANSHSMCPLCCYAVVDDEVEANQESPARNSYLGGSLSSSCSGAFSRQILSVL